MAMTEIGMASLPQRGHGSRGASSTPSGVVAQVARKPRWELAPTRQPQTESPTTNGPSCPLLTRRARALCTIRRQHQKYGRHGHVAPRKHFFASERSVASHDYAGAVGGSSYAISYYEFDSTDSNQKHNKSSCNYCHHGHHRRRRMWRHTLSMAARARFLSISDVQRLPSKYRQPSSGQWANFLP